MATANSPTGPWTQENVVNGIHVPVIPNQTPSLEAVALPIA